MFPTVGDELDRSGIGQGVSPVILEFAPFQSLGVFYLGLRVKGREHWTWFFQGSVPADEIADVLEAVGAVRQVDASFSIADQLLISFVGGLTVAAVGVLIVAASIIFGPAINLVPLQGRPPGTITLFVLFLGSALIAFGSAATVIHARATAAAGH